MNFISPPAEMEAPFRGTQRLIEPTLGKSLSPIAHYYLVAVRRKWIILGSMLALVIVGLIGTLMMTRKYTATTTIEISRDSNKIVKVESVEQERGAGDLEFYQTQYGLLKSRSLAERVANELKLVNNAAFFKMYGEKIEGASEGVDGNVVLSAASQADRRRKAGEVLLRNLGVSPIRLSRLVELSFTSPDPVLSAQVVNAWSKNFINSNLERRFEATSYARRFLEERLAQLRIRLEDSERLLVSYATQQRIINLPSSTADGARSGEDRSIVSDDLSSLNQALAKATAERIAAQSQFEQAASAGSGAVNNALDNVAIGNLRQRRAEVAAELAAQSVRFEPGYPSVRALSSQLSQLDASISREERRVNDSFRTAYREASGRETMLQSRVKNLKVDLLDLRRRSIQYNILAREVDTNRQLYDGLLQRYKEIGVAGGVGTNNIAVVDQAEAPKKPSSPRLLVNLILATIAGLAIGLIAALILEQFDDALSNPADVEPELGLALLGSVPKVNAEPVDAMRDRKSDLVEAYLSLQTNLSFATPHGLPRSVAVTSSRPAEGKSTTAFSIATSIARTNKRVVLVDGDMRSPSIGRMLSLNSGLGLSNYLAGEEDLTLLLQPVEEFGFDVMVAGPQPPNAGELLTGARLEMLITNLLERYDHVIIDCPPVMALADAPLIASRAEGVIYVIESHGIRLSQVKAALDRLAGSHVRIFGAVVTKFESKRSRSGYGYSYGYGYGTTDHNNASPA